MYVYMLCGVCVVHVCGEFKYMCVWVCVICVSVGMYQYVVQYVCVGYNECVGKYILCVCMLYLYVGTRMRVYEFMYVWLSG